MTERTQIVKVNESFSNEEKVARGIPQGTCLGPILFNIYINDLKDTEIKAQNFKFADDSLLMWDLNDIDR